MYVLFSLFTFSTNSSHGDWQEQKAWQEEGQQEDVSIWSVQHFSFLLSMKSLNSICNTSAKASSFLPFSFLPLLHLVHSWDVRVTVSLIGSHSGNYLLRDNGKSSVTLFLIIKLLLCTSFLYNTHQLCIFSLSFLTPFLFISFQCWPFHQEGVVCHQGPCLLRRHQGWFHPRCQDPGS